MWRITATIPPTQHSNPFHLICFISFPLCSTTIKTFPFSIYRFTYVSKAWGIEPKDFDAILNKYIEETTEEGSSDGFTGQLTNIRHNMDSREQFEMLSTVSNFHPLGFPSIQHPQKIRTPNISFHEHIATPENKRYIPTSPPQPDNVLHQIRGTSTSEQLLKVSST